MLTILNLDLTVFGHAESVEGAINRIEQRTPQCRKDGRPNKAVVLATAAEHNFVMLNNIVTFILVD